MPKPGRESAVQAEELPHPNHIYPVQRLEREAGRIYKRLVQIHCGGDYPL